MHTVVNILYKENIHISFDCVKIKGDHGFAKGVKLKGAKVLFSNLGG